MSEFFSVTLFVLCVCTFCICSCYCRCCSGRIFFICCIIVIVVRFFLAVALSLPLLIPSSAGSTCVCFVMAFGWANLDQYIVIYRCVKICFRRHLSLVWVVFGRATVLPFYVSSLCVFQALEDGRCYRCLVKFTFIQFGSFGFLWFPLCARLIFQPVDRNHWISPAKHKHFTICLAVVFVCLLLPMFHIIFHTI